MNTKDDNMNVIMAEMSVTGDTEADILNDETFGNCDLETMKTKSDFGENGEFLGDNRLDYLPAFFDTDLPDTNGISLDNDQSQQPSIDALLAEDPIGLLTSSIHRRSGPFIQQSSMNPLFNMAASQAQETNHMNIFPLQQQQQIPYVSQMTLPLKQINYQVLKQFEQTLINKQVPPQQRLIYIQAMIEKMQRDAINVRQQQMQLQQQAARVSNLGLDTS